MASEGTDRRTSSSDVQGHRLAGERNTGGCDTLLQPLIYCLAIGVEISQVRQAQFVTASLVHSSSSTLSSAKFSRLSDSSPATLAQRNVRNRVCARRVAHHSGRSVNCTKIQNQSTGREVRVFCVGSYICRNMLELSRKFG